MRTTKHWYFKLDKHENWLREWIKIGVLDGQQHHDPKKWKNHVLGQCLSWLDDGLRPRAITRDLDWGIKVPLEEAEGKVLYVWFDAPIGYISSTRQWAQENGKNWEDYWKSSDSKLIHFIGKDNIVFHCIVFPAMLKAHGEYNLPINVPANQFLNFEGQKFSKSRGWGIEQHVYLEEFKDFPNKEDALRYALIRNMPENRDSDFKWDEFIDFHDKELADNLGNFINRVIVLTNKYFDGLIPAPSAEASQALTPAFEILKRYQESVESFNFKSAVQHLMELSSYGNTYFQEAAPWKLFKENPEDPRIADTMYNGLQIVTLLSVLCEPIVPFIAPKIRTLLGLEATQNGDLKTLAKRLEKGEALLPSGKKIGDPAVLFPKINDRKDQSRLVIVNRQKEQLEKIMAAEKGPEREPVKAEIQFDDFVKLDFRTATIMEAEKVKKADKLLKLTIDMGLETRTVVSGIAEYYQPEDIIGQQVVVVANLAPRKLRGILSQGMILMAENDEGKLVFVSPSEPFGNGFTVR